jgi:hypothetical protein
VRVGRGRANAAMKKLLIVFLLLLLLGGGGGAAAWWFYFRAPEVAEDEGPVAPQLSQVELDTIPITVLRNGKPHVRRPAEDGAGPVQPAGCL